MAHVLRFDEARSAKRWLIGVAVTSRCHELTAALVSVVGRGLDARVEIVSGQRCAAPRQAMAMFQQITATSNPVPFEWLSELRVALAGAAANLVGELLSTSGVAAARVLAIGLCDPGWWKAAPPHEVVYVGLSDPARVAEATGLTVIDAFPARDIIQGGQGGPLSPLGHWLLLRAADKDRILLELGRTTRLALLPSGQPAEAVGRIVAFDVGPGMALLDQLAERLTGGQHAFDSGGRLAVQGRRIGELIDHWLGDPYFDRSVPRWHPRGVRPERFLAEAVELAVRQEWSVRDLLCSATHMVAESVARAIERRLPQGLLAPEIVVAGGGQHNGLLLREIAERTGRSLVRLNDAMAHAESCEPACAAVLALCHLDQTPGNLPQCTGAELGRVLGRLTPGSPHNWQRVVESMTQNDAAARVVRAAIG